MNLTSLSLTGRLLKNRLTLTLNLHPEIISDLCRYHLMETMPLSMMKHLEEDVPPVFMILDTYDKDIKVRSNLLVGFVK